MFLLRWYHTCELPDIEHSHLYPAGKQRMPAYFEAIVHIIAFTETPRNGIHEIGYSAYSP